MSKSFKIKAPGENEIVGRLIGFVNDRECTAILNSENDLSKVFTSESMTIGQSIGHMSGKRFVIAIKNNTPSLFISPTIRSISWTGGIPELRCENKKAYKFTETEEE